MRKVADAKFSRWLFQLFSKNTEVAEVLPHFPRERNTSGVTFGEKQKFRNLFLLSETFFHVRRGGETSVTSVMLASKS